MSPHKEISSTILDGQTVLSSAWMEAESAAQSVEMSATAYAVFFL